VLSPGGEEGPGCVRLHRPAGHGLGQRGLFRPDLPNPTVEDAGPAFQATNALPVRWVEPADISNAVLFLAYDEARYITGVPLPVDAGFGIK
jgi:(+)-trans-carveol dehydrogenase